MNKILSGSLVLLSFLLLGEIVNRYLWAQLPASIWGMVLLFAALRLRWVKEEWVAQVAEAIMSNLSLLFLAPAVGIAAIYPLIRQDLAPIGIAVVFSTVCVMAVVGLSIEIITRRQHGTDRK